MGVEVEGVCRKCGETRTFNNLWDVPWVRTESHRRGGRVIGAMRHQEKLDRLAKETRDE